jgi:hypothetical protein
MVSNFESGVTNSPVLILGGGAFFGTTFASFPLLFLLSLPSEKEKPEKKSAKRKTKRSRIICTCTCTCTCELL